MNDSSLGMASQKMTVEKSGLSLVPVAKSKLLDQLREVLNLAITVTEPNRHTVVG